MAARSVVTRRGDAGYTRMADGRRVRKGCDGGLHVLGQIDLLSSQLGCIYARGFGKHQNEVFRREMRFLPFVMGALQCSMSHISDPVRHHVSGLAEVTRMLENAIAACEKSQPPPSGFILPIDSYGLHMARAQCRLAEQAVVRHVSDGNHVHEEVLAFMNRLSDYLYTLARASNGESEKMGTDFLPTVFDL